MPITNTSILFIVIIVILIVCPIEEMREGMVAIDASLTFLFLFSLKRMASAALLVDRRFFKHVASPVVLPHRIALSNGIVVVDRCKEACTTIAS